MRELEAKLDVLRERILACRSQDGALLVVYSPTDELSFRQRYAEIIQEARGHEVSLVELDFRTLPFEVLQAKSLLEKAFTLDANGSRDAHQSLARMVQGNATAHVVEAGKKHSASIICCHSPASLFPWISYSSLLEAVEASITNTLVLPFPGEESGSALHFLSAKDGYNYRATRI